MSSDFAAPNTSLVTKVDLEREILKLSGRIAQNPGPNTTYVVADRVIAKVGSVVTQHIGDLVLRALDWLPGFETGRPKSTRF